MTSTVQIIYDPSGVNDDITGDVMFADATFEMQMNAVPGTATFRVKDEAQTHSFVTGREVQLWIDGVQMWGGYIRRVNRTFPFLADDTVPAATYKNRIWQIDAVDYNILFDNLIIRNPANYTGHVPDATGYVKTTQDGWALWKLLYSFCDFPSGFGITSDRNAATEIDDVTTVLPSDATQKFKYKQQGTKIREQFKDLAQMSRATFYISGDKKVHYHSWEDMEKRWGFSDNPNWNAVTASPTTYQGADWGFHEVTGEEDGSLIVNDVIIWGGSPFGSNGTVIYKRLQDTDSQTEHGRWQLGELHFNEFGTQGRVDARAWAILEGPPGATNQGVLKGLRYPQWKLTFEWWADQVPAISSVRDHIKAGEFVRIELETFGLTGAAVLYAPCRTLRITFPQLDPQGDAHVLFTGEFSYSYTDSIGMWAAMLENQRGTPTVIVSTVGNDSTTAKYGDFGTFSAFTPDGNTTVFDLPNDLGYIYQTLQVQLNGIDQRRGTDYFETDPAAGTFTFATAPLTTDTIIVYCRMLAKT